MGRKVFVTVHGIGDQKEFETAQSVAIRLTDFLGESKTDHGQRFSYGNLASSIGSVLAVNRARAEQNPATPPEAGGVFWWKADDGLEYGVSEVYWADICRLDANDGYRLQETVSWAESVVDQLKVKSNQKVAEAKQAGDTLQAAKLAEDERNYRLAGSVFSELGTGLNKLNQFLKLRSLAGMGDVQIGDLLTQFLGDVQYVTEFKDIRERVIARFLDRMASLEIKPDDEIIVISHSEGTVVSFLGLLTALLDSEAVDSNVSNWRSQVTGFVTLGSPIDKHLTVWGELWSGFEGEHGVGSCKARDDNQPKILWYNYYDFGDPVGFDLNQAREWIDQTNWKKHIQFEKTTDFGFTRYGLPGKAHVDYWNDHDLFGHIFSTVGGITLNREYSSPQPRRFQQITSYIIPYIFAVGLMMSGTYAILTGVHSAQGIKVSSGLVFYDTLAFGSLFCGMTILARIPILVQATTRRWIWWGIAAAIFAGCVFVFCHWLPKETKENMLLGVSGFLKHLESLEWIGHADREGLTDIGRVTWVSAALALGVVLVSLIFKLSIIWLVRLACCAVAIQCFLMVGFTSDKALAKFADNHPSVSRSQTPSEAGTGESEVESEEATKTSLGPVVIGSLFFLYLWYLAAVMFDLAFFWHRYMKSARSASNAANQE